MGNKVVPRKKNMIDLAAVVVVLVIAVPSLAVNPGDGVQPPEATTEKDSSGYTAPGKFGDGYLTEEMIPGAYQNKETENTFENCPVILKSYLPYPNPYSHLMAYVAVVRQANFRLEVRDGSEKIINAFTFTGIEAGFYRFTCDRTLPSTELAVVFLKWNGIDVGRMVVREKFLNPGN